MMPFFNCKYFLNANRMPTSEKRKIRLLQLEKTILKSSRLLVKKQNRNHKLGWIRLFIFLSGLIIFFTLFFLKFKTLSLISLFPIIGIFTAFTIIHNKTIQAITVIQKWIEIKKDYLARTGLDWTNIPAAKSFSQKNSAPMEIDLDLAGERSLHQLLDFSKSREGSLFLRKLLIESPRDREEILYNQALINELLSLSHFRDKFLLINYLSSKENFETKNLIKWISEIDKISPIKKKIFLLGFLCLVNLIFIILAVSGTVPTVYLFTLLLYFGVYYFNRDVMSSSLSEAESISDQLKKIISILSFLENYKFGTHEKLLSLCSPLQQKELSPSVQLRKINNVFSVLHMRKNPFLWFFLTLIFPMDYYLAYKLELYKKKIVKNLPIWLEILHKLETFVSLSNFAYLNPDYSFPVIRKEGILQLTAKKLSHPLIDHQNNVPNDFEIKENGKISIITGSNMSGKSTFLRTIGVNVRLAFIGAPVYAESLSLSLFRQFTCIRVSDSVTDGISYFYAEVKRLKMLIDDINLPNEIPVVFLIDEIYKGTNNFERLQGSRALIKSLVDKNGSGVISTHDLELVKLADEIPAISNFHFREEVLDKIMLFDYKLKTGPCPTTNALKIMKANGLPI